jgi:hypothetical protein
MKHIKSFDVLSSKTNENILPKPYKKVKCAECGEDVCDNINYKIGHLYNKHNCKPSVDDYKAKKMLKQYFPMAIKENVDTNLKSMILEIFRKNKVDMYLGDYSYEGVTDYGIREEDFDFVADQIINLIEGNN